MKSRTLFNIFIFLVLTGLGGCSPALEYRAGLYTKTVVGKIELDSPRSPNQMFILVLDYHRTLVETADGYLNQVTAFIAYPDEKGNYAVPFAVDTVKLELTFYAFESRMIVQEFRRSLGIGSYAYNVRLKEDDDWKNSYYLRIKPILVGYITEKRYQMSQRDRFFVGEWISTADERF